MAKFVYLSKYFLMISTLKKSIVCRLYKSDIILTKLNLFNLQYN